MEEKIIEKTVLSVDAEKEIDLIKKDHVYANMAGTLKNIQNRGDKIKVTDSKTEIEAIEFCKEIKVLSKKMDEYRKQLIKEPGEIVKFVNGYFNPKIKAIGEIETIVKKNQLGVFYRKLEQIEEEKRRVIEVQNQKKLDKFEKKVEEAEDKGGSIDDVKAPTLKDMPTGKTITATSKAKSVRTVTQKWRCPDISKVPREYLMLDEKKINAVFKHIDIKGIEKYNDYSARIS